MTEKCPDRVLTLLLTAYSPNTTSGKERIGFNPILSAKEVKPEQKLGRLCRKCHWNSMGISKSDLE
ncbi:hypothetical protein K0U27_03440 [archaeon]|nr:hypothetical protein [archaeon]